MMNTNASSVSTVQDFHEIHNLYIRNSDDAGVWSGLHAARKVNATPYYLIEFDE